MTKEFETDAMRYLLDELAPAERAAFEDKLTRFHGARIALAECTESLAALRRQALDLPFFGSVVRSEIATVLRALAAPRPAPVRRGVRKLRQLVALS